MASVRHFSLAYNNVYLVETSDARVVIDTGPDYRGAREQLAAELRDSPVDLVIATHGHVDHSGLGSWWQRRGTPVALHEEDAHFARGVPLSDAEFASLVAFTAESGAPEALQAAAIAGLEARRSWAREMGGSGTYPAPGPGNRWPTGLRATPFEPARLLSGPLVEAAPGVHVIHCPGHTPGNVVVWLPAEGWLFSGDQLLPEITPTPPVQFSGDGARYLSFPAFLTSLARLKGLGVSRCWPGHGDPFEDAAAVIEANVAQAEQRAERLAAALRAHPGATLFEVAAALYPKTLRRRFWQVISTVQGLLDELTARGMAEQQGGRWPPADIASWRRFAMDPGAGILKRLFFRRRRDGLCPPNL